MYTYKPFGVPLCSLLTFPAIKLFTCGIIDVLCVPAHQCDLWLGGWGGGGRKLVHCYTSTLVHQYPKPHLQALILIPTKSSVK